MIYFLRLNQQKNCYYLNLQLSPKSLSGLHIIYYVDYILCLD